MSGGPNKAQLKFIESRMGQMPKGPKGLLEDGVPVDRGEPLPVSPPDVSGWGKATFAPQFGMAQDRAKYEKPTLDVNGVGYVAPNIQGTQDYNRVAPEMKSAIREGNNQGKTKQMNHRPDAMYRSFVTNPRRMGSGMNSTEMKRRQVHGDSYWRNLFRNG